MSDFIYKPEEIQKLPEECKIAVKFSENITFLESFLKQKNISYQQDDLEDTALGRGYVVRKECFSCVGSKYNCKIFKVE